jgi:hypothetical protein
LPEVERAFMQVVIDLKEILVLDGIDVLDSPSGFRIRCHDLYGPLPDTVIEDTGDRYTVLDSVIREAAKRIAMARIRQELMGVLPGSEFLPPTSTDGGVLVGIRTKGKTILTEGPTFWDAYHELWRKAVGDET